jgi:hypothetical protein
MSFSCKINDPQATAPKQPATDVKIVLLQSEELLVFSGQTLGYQESVSTYLPLFMTSKGTRSSEHLNLCVMQYLFTQMGVTEPYQHSATVQILKRGRFHNL